MRVKCEPGAAPSRDPPSCSKNTRIQISVLMARQKICDGSTSPAQKRSNVSASAAASQYGPFTELRRAEQALHHRAPSPQPARLGGGEPDLPAAGAHLLGEHAPKSLAQDGAAPAPVDERRRRQPQHPVDQLLVEERQPRLHGERHRVAVLVPEQRRQRERLEVGDESALHVVLRPLELRRLEPVVERGAQERLDRERVATIGEAALHQRLQHVARRPRLAR